MSAYDAAGVTDVDAALRQIAEREAVFLRREVLASGLDDRFIRRAVRSGRWVKVRHGAYTFGDAWRTADEAGRLVTLTRAVMRETAGDVAASHHSGSALHGMELWDVPFDQAHLTRLDAGAGRSQSDVVHHEGVCSADDLVELHGVPVVRPARAALESSLLAGVERGLVTADSGLHRGLFQRQELLDQHEAMAQWPGSQPLHLVTRLADGRSESVGESRSRYLFWSQGLPMPELQFEVRDGHRLVGVADFAWPEHRLLGEFDGRVKYGRLLREGEEPGDAVFREKKREDLLRRLTGWSMVRFTWEDLYRPRQTSAVVRQLMWRAA
ncbi:MAG: hypothetical protein QOK15_730 [Nocardioidaceae bacterium]|nr:hypothetical protein [Nocardioidaceae bacterium]